MEKIVNLNLFLKDLYNSEELYTDLIKKQKTYIYYTIHLILYHLVPNEDDNNYPYECAFDFEVILKKLEQ